MSFALIPVAVVNIILERIKKKPAYSNIDKIAFPDILKVCWHFFCVMEILIRKSL